MTQTKKGFTLVELLIVIGILGILAAAVVVVLNPAELLAQARDSQRIQDLAGINSALGLYVVSTSTPTLGEALQITQAGAYCDEGEATVTVNATRVVTGTGWVTVNLQSLTGGSPISVLPIDPVNTGVLGYCYDGDNTNKTWELTTVLESAKFVNGGGSDKESTDGGTDPDVYEIGSDPGLDLIDA